MNFKNIKIVYKDQIKNGSLNIKNGKIESIDNTSDLDGYNLPEYYLVPGFIDQHIHGASGFDFMDGTQEAFDEISKVLLKEGTTSFLATTMTQSVQNIKKAVYNLRAQKLPGANLIGVHLEGPFINKIYKGAQPEEYIIPPSVELFKEINKYENIKIISMAVEEDTNFNLSKYAVENNVIVSQAHTNASYEISTRAIKKGVKGFTHGYNAMSKLHHRDIGVVGSMLLNNESYAEIIVDGIHVSPNAIELIYKNKTRENLILVTDSMRAKNLPDGKSEIGGQTVFVKNNKATLIDGTLAGSTLRMNEALKNIMTYTDATLVDAVYMASTNPARNLSLKTKGEIKEGYDADLTVLDKELNVIMTIVNGEVLYDSRD